MAPDIHRPKFTSPALINILKIIFGLWNTTPGVNWFSHFAAGCGESGFYLEDVTQGENIPNWWGNIYHKIRNKRILSPFSLLTAIRDVNL